MPTVTSISSREIELPLQPDTANTEHENQLGLESHQTMRRAWSPFSRGHRGWRLTTTDKSPVLSLGLAASDLIRTRMLGQPSSIFDQLQDIRDKKLNQVIISFRHSECPFSTRIADRLKFLFEAAREEDDVISLESLRTFITFLEANPQLKYPDVVLSPAGNIRAEWRNSQNSHFAAEFLPNSNARFVVFAPRLDTTRRIAGLIPSDELMRAVEPYDVLSWASL